MQTLVYPGVHSGFGRSMLGLALLGAVLMVVAPTGAAAKVMRPNSLDRLDERSEVETKPAKPAPAVAQAQAQTQVQTQVQSPTEATTTAAAAQPAPRNGRTAASADPNRADPLTERAAAAAERAKRALIDEDPDFAAETEVEPASNGQPATAEQRRKTAASAPFKPAAKCVAGC